MGPMFRFTADFFFALVANWKIGGAMEGNASDVESGCASGGGNEQLILSIQHSKPRADGSNQTTFSRAAFSKHSKPQLRADLAPSKSMICNDTKDALLCFVQRELINYIHNRRVVVEEDVRGLVCAIAGHTGLLTRRGGDGGVAEPLRLDLKIGERKAKGNFGF